MGDPKASFKGRVEIDPDTSGSWEKLENVTEANADMLQDQIEASHLGDEGERRINGRVDFTLEATLNFTFSESTHTDLLDAARGGGEVGVRVLPDEDESDNYIEAVCNVESGSLSLSGDDASPMDVSFENSDGNKWSYSTE